MSNAQRQASPLLKLLAQIDSGISIYEPFNRSPEIMREFADTVSRLEEMKRLGKCAPPGCKPPNGIAWHRYSHKSRMT
jgi:hypothetical protein